MMVSRIHNYILTIPSESQIESTPHGFNSDLLFTPAVSSFANSIAASTLESVPPLESFRNYRDNLFESIRRFSCTHSHWSADFDRRVLTLLINPRLPQDQQRCHPEYPRFSSPVLLSPSDSSFVSIPDQTLTSPSMDDERSGRRERLRFKTLGFFREEDPGTNSDYGGLSLVFLTEIKACGFGWVIDDIQPSTLPPTVYYDKEKVSSLIVQWISRENIKYFCPHAGDPRKQWRALEAQHQRSTAGSMWLWVELLVGARLCDSTIKEPLTGCNWTLNNSMLKSRRIKLLP